MIKIELIIELIIEFMALVILGYLLGSISFSYLIAKMRKVNLKERVKNGRIGASSVRKNIGWPWAGLAGLLDTSKGALAVFLAQRLTNSDLIVIFSGLASIFGHNWSLFLKFWGGKGFTPTIGSFVVLFPKTIILAIPLLLPFYFFAIKRKEIIGMKKTSFFTGLSYLTISLINYLKNLSFPLVIYPILAGLPMVLKKN